MPYFLYFYTIIIRKKHIDIQSVNSEKVHDLLAENERLKGQLEQQANLLQDQVELLKKLGAQEDKILKMQNQLDALLRTIFGKKSERFTPSDLETGQLNIFGAEEGIQNEEEQETEDISYTRTKKRKEKPVRRPLPEHLPREIEIIEPDIDTTGMIKIGEEITEILEVEPARLYVRRIVRPKYAYSKEENGELTKSILVAPLPDRPFKRIIAGNSVLTLICVEKFVDHLPFYRQIQRYTRQNIELKASTINDWFVAVCNLLIPLYNILRKSVLQTDYIQADESHIKVQITQLKDKKRKTRKPPPKGKTHTGQMWVYRNPGENTMFFEYKQTRGAEHPVATLENYQGYLQTDAYSAYNVFEALSGFTTLRCMAHACRKFEEAIKNNKVVAEIFMVHIQKLYVIEKELKKQRPENQSDEDFYAQRLKVRQEKAIPLLDEMKKDLDKYRDEVLPKRLIGKAVNYTLNNWICI